MISRDPPVGLFGLHPQLRSKLTLRACLCPRGRSSVGRSASCQRVFMETSTSSTTRNLALGSTVAALILSVVAVVMVPSTVRGILSSRFLPHAYCYLYDKQLIALNAGSDALIWLSYIAISCTLVYLVRRTRHEIPFSWMFLAFGLFIVACGFTHLMEVVVLWRPFYWLAGDVKLITAVASVVTAIALPGLIPQVHAMVTSARLSEDRRRQLERANTELQHLSGHVMGVQEEERRRVARELHDGIGQYLAAIKMSCAVALEQSERGDKVESLKSSLDMIDRCTADVRSMSHLLHPPLLEEMGLASAVPWYVQGFTQKSGIPVEVDVPAQLERLPRAVEIVLFRVLQESLTNVQRHSGSELAKVRLFRDDGRVLLTIEDRGKGFGSGHGDLFQTGVGIAGMRERVREQGGELRISSGKGGTKVEATVPINKEVGCRNGSSS
jgi:signal transduction histidine kinase